MLTAPVRVMQFLARNNFYILIDDHSEDPTVQNNPNQWVQYWVQLMTDITSDGPSKLRVMVDLLNEPDHASYTWSTVSSAPCIMCWLDNFCGRNEQHRAVSD